jgi:integrase
MAPRRSFSSPSTSGPIKSFKIGRNPKTLVEVSIYATNKGRFMAAFYDAAGKRIRPERSTVADAEQAARDYVAKHISPEALEESLVVSKAAKMVAPVDLITACSEFAEARTLLRPLNATVLDAVRYFVEKKGDYLKSVPVAVAVDEFFSKFKGRKKTEKANRVYLGRLKKDWGELKLSEIDHVFINRWIGGLRGTERTKRNYFDGVSLLFRHAKEHGWFPLERKSPTEHANRPEAENPQIELFSPEEGTALLKTASELESPAFAVIALVGWSGCRTEEIAPEFSDKGRLRWDDILWADAYKGRDGAGGPTEDQIHVTPDAAKRTRKKDLRRYIPLLPNLAKMLRTLRGNRGPIYPSSLRNINKEFARVAKKAGVEWKRNALRHSFGTFRTALTKNIPAVAFEMGNTPEMVSRHYNRPTPPHIADQWFRINVYPLLDNPGS